VQEALKDNCIKHAKNCQIRTEELLSWQALCSQNCTNRAQPLQTFLNKEFNFVFFCVCPLCHRRIKCKIVLALQCSPIQFYGALRGWWSNAVTHAVGVDRSEPIKLPMDTGLHCNHRRLYWSTSVALLKR